MYRQRWTGILALLFVSLLGWYLIYTEQIVRALHDNAGTLTRIYSDVLTGLSAPTEEALDETLFQLQSRILQADVPIVQSGAGDTILAVENLPFDVDIRTPEGQAQVRTYLRVLDAEHEPVLAFGETRLHYGDPVEVRRLRWIPWLQASGLVLTLLIGLTVIRAQRRAAAERAWTSMARELAHQLGTPLSSLKGWMEVLRLTDEERPAGVSDAHIAGSIEDDLERLERVSHRFELIGRAPKLEPLDLADVLRELEAYLRARLPTLGPGVKLNLRLPDDLPAVAGNRVLLVWAMENVVKNALDALAGSGGTIQIRASGQDPGHVTVEIADDGPGVGPEVRDRIFEPGVTTKSGGWGVGLALSRRIVEGVHGGRILLLETPGRGATFQIRLPRTKK